MKNTVRRVTIHYSLIHALYWMTHCLMFNFASAFMLDCGYSNSQIGIVIGLSCAFSAVLQPGLGAFFSRSNVKLNLSVAGLYLPIILLTLLMITLPMNRFFLGAAMVAVFAMQSMLQPGINSLHRGYVHQGMHINYGLARGVGSISFALASFVVGQLLRRFAASIIPLLYLCSAAILALVIFLFRAPQDREEGNVRKNDISYSAMLRQHRHFPKRPTFLPLWHLFFQRVGCHECCLGTTVLFAEQDRSRCVAHPANRSQHSARIPPPSPHL